nr:hypothetical protein CFP56_50380 [Quercus suber]
MNWPEFTCGAKFDIQDNQCNPWNLQISRNDAANPAGKIQWAAQVTAPMPLEAIYFLWKRQFLNRLASKQPDADARSDFFLGLDMRAKTSLITKEHFRSNKNGINPADMTDDVLGFCTLVMSYAKAAHGETLKPGSSPKIFTTFMPRTEFNTMFQQVSSKLKGDLFTLFDSLACYKPAIPLELNSDGYPLAVTHSVLAYGEVLGTAPDGNVEGGYTYMMARKSEAEGYDPPCPRTWAEQMRFATAVTVHPGDCCTSASTVVRNGTAFSSVPSLQGTADFGVYESRIAAIYRHQCAPEIFLLPNTVSELACPRHKG